VKPFADWAFCHGINRFVLHRYAHQPWTAPIRVPGMTMGPWGLHYERTQTWWEQSKPWHEYLARCQYLLQQGRFNADICYLSSEDSPWRWLQPNKSRERPPYNFDACPPDVVLNRMAVKNGRLTLPDGMNYRLLVLPEAETTMTPELLRKLKELVSAGATVLGAKPIRSPSLSGHPQCDAEVRQLADELWANCDGMTIREHQVGKGRIVCGVRPEEFLAREGLAPDFLAEATRPESIRYIHKIVGDADVYFLANKYDEPCDALCQFRVSGKQPELWRPDSGAIEIPAVHQQLQTTTQLSVHFDPFGSVFVIFRPPQGAPPQPITSLSRVSDHSSTNPESLVTNHELQVTNYDSQVTNHSSPASTFTFAVWVRPEIEVDLREESNAGIAGLKVIRNDALYPPPGDDLYPEPNQAGSGLSVGRNAICVFEHAANYFGAPLVFAGSFRDWTHVTIVYRDNRPTLYVNGKFAHEGVKSDFTVHCGVGVKHTRGVAPFRGDVGAFRQFDRALSPEEIARLKNEMALPQPRSDLPDAEVFRDQRGRLEAHIWRAGDYEARSGEKTVARFDATSLPAPYEITGPWDLRFPPGWGAPEKVNFEKLISWTDSPDQGIKYFSGTAGYLKSFRLPQEFRRKGQRVFLDLGKVAVMAEVLLNGKELGVLWKPPFRIDITDALKPAANQLEIKLTNLWPNRMIGDEQLAPDSKRKPNGTLDEWPDWVLAGKSSPSGRFTFTTWEPWKKDSALQESGLLGPVTIRACRKLSE